MFCIRRATRRLAVLDGGLRGRSVKFCIRCARAWLAVLDGGLRGKPGKLNSRGDAVARRPGRRVA